MIRKFNEFVNEEGSNYGKSEGMPGEQALLQIDSATEPAIMKFVNNKINSGTWKKKDEQDGMSQILFMSGQILASVFAPSSDLDSLPMAGKFKIGMNTTAGSSFTGHTIYLYK
jgi:hypothetical protein